MPGDLYTAPRIISLSPLSLAPDVTDETLGASGLWLGTRTGAGSTATLTEIFFFFLSQPMAPWKTGHEPGNINLYNHNTNTTDNNGNNHHL